MAFRVDGVGARERVSRKLTIGAYPAIGLAEARTAARHAAAAVERGRDPVADKKAAIEKAVGRLIDGAD